MSTNKVIFTIDLLNGQAIPLQSKPGGLAFVVVTAVIPVTFAMGMFSLYVHNNIAMKVKQREITRCEAETCKMSDAVKLQNALEKEKTTYKDSLTDVRSSIKRHTQWSPILTTLIEDMPDSVVLTSIEVEHNSVKKKVPKNGDSKKMVEVDVLARVLRLTVSSGSQRNCDDAVREYRDRLRASPLLGPKLENIAVAQQTETRQGRDVVSYEINCIFKPGL